MKRTTAETKIGTTQIRNRVKIEDEPGDPRYRLHLLLADLASNPALLACGYETAQRISIVHNGQNWVVEAEAVTTTGG
jgi:hypothetical protein